MLAHSGREGILRAIADAGLVLHLFTNDVKPVKYGTTDIHDEPDSGSGYKPVRLPGGDTLEITEEEDDKGTFLLGTYPQQSFLFTGRAGLVYGWFRTWRETGELYDAERFEDAHDVRNDGDELKLNPVLPLRE